MSEIWKDCKTDGCAKKVKEPFFFCYNCNMKRKAEKENRNEVQQSIPVEEIKSPSESCSRQKAITLGQAMNLSHQHLRWNSPAVTPEEFNNNFKEETKRFFKLALELQEELL